MPRPRITMASCSHLLCRCVLLVSYPDMHAWKGVHEKSAPFIALFEPSKFKRCVKEIQINRMTEAGMGFLSR